jgi:hypothetical protein
MAGTVFAAPLFMMDVPPFPRIPEGPKAYFNIDMVYADLSVSEVDDAELMVAYTIVANITNLSGREGHLYETGFAGAQHVEQLDSALGGMYISRALFDSPQYFRAFGRGGVVEGVYLDDTWLAETWIPGTDYPSNLITVLNTDYDEQNAVLSVIPQISPVTLETGTWIEGVPVVVTVGFGLLQISGCWFLFYIAFL